MKASRDLRGNAARLTSLAVPPRHEAVELLDSPESVLADLPANLADIRRLNRHFGGASSTIPAVNQIAKGLSAYTLLDVGTGSADIPLALLKAASARGQYVEVTAIDSSPAILGVARQV